MTGIVLGTLRLPLLKIEEVLAWSISELIPPSNHSNRLVLLPTTQSPGRKKCLGHFWPDKWSTLEGDLYAEVNFTAESLGRPFMEVIETCVHEVTHAWCYSMGISDTRKSGQWHNKKFRDAATEIGLVCQEPVDGYGYGHTSLSDELAEKIEKEFKPDIESLGLFRLPNPPSRPTTRAYVCGCGGFRVRAPMGASFDAYCQICTEPFEEVA